MKHINNPRATIPVLEELATKKAKDNDITIDEARRLVALSQGFRSWDRMVESRLQ